MVQELGLPQIRQNDGHDLFVLSTGSYGITGGQIALTATREYELKDSRANLGSLEQYNALASQIPDSTDVLYYVLQTMPVGFNQAVHGPWVGSKEQTLRNLSFHESRNA